MLLLRWRRAVITLTGLFFRCQRVSKGQLCHAHWNLHAHLAKRIADRVKKGPHVAGKNSPDVADTEAIRISHFSWVNNKPMVA
jgi:hypothetical protein